MTNVEQEYAARLAKMSVAEKVARSEAMLKWTRDMIGRQITGGRDDYDMEVLKWQVAARLYANEPLVLSWIERILERVSDRSV